MSLNLPVADDAVARSNPAADPAAALALELIAREVAGQDKMWGATNDRADASKGQLLNAALAQADAINLVRRTYFKRAVAFEEAHKTHYPLDWNGFRDYGSDVANLVVAAAFIQQEIKRLIAAGESTYRAPRTEPYKGPDKPAMPFPDQPS